MPKASRSDEEIARVKEDILQAALDILVEEGFSSLSMHKVGSRMNMTAANLYNYYANKDELLIAIHKKTFGMLYEQLREVAETAPDPLERTARLVRRFVEFGIKNPSFYDIMFNRDIPQRSDYLGTPQEELSEDEFRSSIKSLLLAVEAVRDLVETCSGLEDLDPAKYTVRALCEVHGVISLYNSGLLFELVDDPDEMIEGMIRHVLEPLSAAREAAGRNGLDLRVHGGTGSRSGNLERNGG